KQRLLVIIMDYSACRAPAALSEFGARNIFMGKPSPVGLGSGITQKYLQCSYGKLNITAFKAITVTANCSSNEPGPSFSTCPVLRFIKDGSSGAKDILGEDAFLSDFSHYVYVLPPGVNEFCRGDWAAVPGRQIVLRTLLGSLERWSATLELTLHNFGLWHSWQGGHEFEDGSSPSGRKDVCPNAPELAYLGWTSPVKGGGQVDANTLPVGTVRSFNLPATYLTSDGHFVRVVPDWLPTYSNRTGAKNLYIAVRVNKGGDALLAAPYANAVNVHEVNATMDNDASRYPYTDRKISFINSAAPRSQVVLTDYKLVLYGGSWVSTDVLRVHFCRYRDSPRECPSLDSLEAALPPPPRKNPLPSPKQSKAADARRPPPP
ncbi:metalloproteinase, extracellular matrix glycoprotein VMP35, partial [Volvox carteri f. nagariensis]